MFEASEFHYKVAERVFHTAAQPTKSLQYSKALVRDEARLALLRKVSRLNGGLCITSGECIDTSERCVGRSTGQSAIVCVSDGCLMIV